MPTTPSRSAGSHLAPRPALLLVAGATVLVVVAVIGVIGTFVAFYEWQDYRFDRSPYCKAEPADPLC